MRTIRSRLRIVGFFLLLATGVSGYLTYQSFLHYRDALTKASESLDVRSFLTTLNMTDYHSRTHDRLQEVRKKLTPESRKQVFSDLIQAYAEQDKALILTRLAFARDQEEKLFIENRKQLQTRMQKIEKQGAITLAIPMCGLLMILFYLRLSIFRPLDRLSRRMHDFLVDRYSFQFSEPEASELGDLQRTFNSLAQRVINNMDELKTLDQAKSEFLSIASHELRTPMTSIKGSLTLLTSGVMGTLDPNSMRLIKIAEAETDRLIRLINDLLDLAKIEAGKLPLACSWHSWDEFMQTCAEGLSGLALKANVQIVVEAAPHLEIFMDKDRLQQVLTNLISNAIKFSPENGSVFVRVHKRPDHDVAIEVKDQGIGIAPEDQVLIFQKFRQAGPASNLVKGTGLGLTIAKALVEEHGGEIGVTSEPKRGSTFYFTLPKWRDDRVDSEVAA